MTSLTAPPSRERRRRSSGPPGLARYKESGTAAPKNNSTAPHIHPDQAYCTNTALAHVLVHIRYRLDLTGTAGLWRRGRSTRRRSVVRRHPTPVLNGFGPSEKTADQADASKLEEYKSLVAKLTGAHVTELISYLHGFDDSKFRTEANDLMADTTDETRRTVEAALFHTAKASLIKLMTRLSAGGKGEEGSGSGPEQDPPSVSVSSKDGGG